MKPIFFLLTFVFFYLSNASAQSVRLYGYVQKTTPGIAAARDIDENGNTQKIDNASTEGYHIYFSTPSRNRLYPIEGWIKGKRVGLKAEVVTSPVTATDEQGEEKTLVAKTSDKVYLLSGTELMADKSLAHAEKLSKINELVVVYKLNGKIQYAVLKKLQSLPTAHLE